MIFMTDGCILVYKLCEAKINSHKKNNVQQHIDRVLHKQF